MFCVEGLPLLFANWLSDSEQAGFARLALALSVIRTAALPESDRADSCQVGHCTRCPLHDHNRRGLTGRHQRSGRLRGRVDCFRMLRDSGVGFGSIDWVDSFRMRRHPGAMRSLIERIGPWLSILDRD